MGVFLLDVVLETGSDKLGRKRAREFKASIVRTPVVADLQHS